MKQIEDIYEDVLKGNRKRFPLYTWEKDNHGYDNFNRCLRYIANKLKLTREQIVDIDHEFIKKYKLRGALAQLYGQNIKPAIINALPEYNLKEWEFFRTSKDLDFVQAALRDIIERRGWSREVFLENRSDLYKDKDMYRILDWMLKNKYEIAPTIQELLPEYNFTIDELTQRIDRSRLSDSIRHTFEEVLKWETRDIVENMTLEIAETHFPEAYAEYRNVLKMVQSVYPEIHRLKKMESPLTEETEMLIISDLKSGVKTKDILQKYGIGRQTLIRIKRQHNLLTLPKDITGQTFGKLTVLEKADGGKWKCICECGEIKYVAKGNLLHGGTRSCGSTNCRGYTKK